MDHPVSLFLEQRKSHALIFLSVEKTLMNYFYSLDLIYNGYFSAVLDKQVGYYPGRSIPLTFLVITLSTLKIFQIVCRHQRQIHQQQQCFSANLTNFRKSAVTVVFVRFACDFGS